MESLLSSYDDAKTTKVAKKYPFLTSLGRVAVIWSEKGFVLIVVHVIFFP